MSASNCVPTPLWFQVVSSLLFLFTFFSFPSLPFFAFLLLSSRFSIASCLPNFLCQKQMQSMKSKKCNQNYQPHFYSNFGCACLGNISVLAKKAKAFEPILCVCRSLCILTAFVVHHILRSLRSCLDSLFTSTPSFASARQRNLNGVTIFDFVSTLCLPRLHVALSLSIRSKNIFFHSTRSFRSVPRFVYAPCHFVTFFCCTS